MSESLENFHTLPTGEGVPTPSGASLPESLWYDDAIEALGAEGAPASRLAALRMLARTPKSWDPVLLTALTAADEELQAAAIQTLVAVVRLEPQRLRAFERLKDLPVLKLAARQAWEAGWVTLSDAPPSTEPLDFGQASIELAGLRQENDDLRKTGQALQVDLEASRRRIAELEQRLNHHAALDQKTQEQLESECRTKQRDIDALAQQVRSRELELDRLFSQADQVQRSRVRWMYATACSTLATLGLAALLASGRAPVFASEPPGAVLKASETAGYRGAMAAMASEASRLEVDGDLEASLGAWQCIARSSKDQGLAAHAAQRVAELNARIAQGDRLGAHQQLEIPRRVAPAVTKPRALMAPPKPMATPRPVAERRRAAVKPPPVKPRPVFQDTPSMPEVHIPLEVRQKF